MKNSLIQCLLGCALISFDSCQQPVKSDHDLFNPEQEKVMVEQVIHDGICWAMTKDTTALYNAFIQDSTLFIFNPDSASTLTGFKTLRYLAENVWMTDRFKATECNIKDLRISFSKGGDVAWYSCYLDDIGEWDGKKTGWRNVRWTGVLEKREGKWKLMQMHFSFPLERFR